MFIISVVVSEGCEQLQCLHKPHKVETLLHMKRKTKGKLGGVALKVDISKLYDRVDWRYLKCILIKIGFDTRRVQLIMECVSSVRYSILLNDRSIGPVQPQHAFDEVTLFRLIYLMCWRPFSTNSKSGRTRINSWLQSMPRGTHCLPSFIRWWQFLLYSIHTEEIRWLLNSFWWDSKKDNQRCIHWLSWDRLSIRKEKGDLGFRDLYDFNLAMSGRQGWSFISSPDTLASRIFNARYFRQGDFLSAQLGHNPSIVWKSIWCSQSLLQIGCRWKIGDGTKLIFGMILGPWIREDDSFKIQTSMISRMESLTVAELMIPGEMKWNVDLTKELFHTRDTNAISKIPVHEASLLDTRVWHYSKNNGKYTVKSGYWVVSEIMMNTLMTMEGGKFAMSCGVYGNKEMINYGIIITALRHSWSMEHYIHFMIGYKLKREGS